MNGVAPERVTVLEYGTGTSLESHSKMFKIRGLDKLQKDLSDAQKALEAVNGELGSVKFDPHDAASIEAAIQEAERLIDDRVGSYDSNPIVRPLIDGAKEQFRQGILDQAAAARLSGRQD